MASGQFFVFIKPLVCDIYPRKITKHFVHTFLANIRCRGAMSKLIGGRAQVEINNKVQEIL